MLYVVDGKIYEKDDESVDYTECTLTEDTPGVFVLRRTATKVNTISDDAQVCTLVEIIAQMQEAKQVTRTEAPKRTSAKKVED